MAIREGLMQAYSQGGVNSWRDLWEIMKAASVGGGKGAIIGGATMGAGRVTGNLVARTAAPALVRTASMVAAETATMATTAAALEGRLPTAQEFADAAILVGGVRTAVKVSSNLRTIFSKTGIPPDQVALEAQRDPVLREELMTEAYHGTPHDIGPEGFKLQRIGTGEGAQAYGWGLYFAESKGVASFYTKVPKKAEMLDRLEGLASLEDPNALTSKEWAKLEQLRADPESQKIYHENLYKVELPKDKVSRMLDWDVPMERQSEEVRAVAEKFPFYRPEMSGEQFYKRLVSEESAASSLTKEMATAAGIDPSSADMSSLATGQLSSTYLKSLGIPGIKYLDQASRRMGAGTHNLVVFDDKIVSLIEKNGKPIVFDVPTKYQALAAEENAKAAVPGPEVQDRATAVKFVQNPFGEWSQKVDRSTEPPGINHKYLNA
jgi:hypothetical protein